MQIVVLSQNACNPCTEVKNFLTDEGVEFIEINISEKPNAVEEFNIMSTPVTILFDEGEEIVRVNGYKRMDLEALINQF